MVDNFCTLCNSKDVVVEEETHRDETSTGLFYYNEVYTRCKSCNFEFASEEQSTENLKNMFDGRPVDGFSDVSNRQMIKVKCINNDQSNSVLKLFEFYEVYDYNGRFYVVSLGDKMILFHKDRFQIKKVD